MPISPYKPTASQHQSFIQPLNKQLILCKVTETTPRIHKGTFHLYILSANVFQTKFGNLTNCHIIQANLTSQLPWKLKLSCVPQYLAFKINVADPELMLFIIWTHTLCCLSLCLLQTPVARLLNLVISTS